MPRTYPVDLEAEGHHVRAVSVTCGLRPVSELRAESPAYGAHIEIPAMIELLDLIAAGVVTLAEVRSDLLELGTDLNQDEDRDDDRPRQALKQPKDNSRQSDQIQQADTRWVYVVSSEDNPKVVKIGVAGNIGRRIKNLQVAAPTRIILRWSSLGGLPLESYLHEKFHRRRLSGEWFDFRKVSNPAKVIEEAAQIFLDGMDPVD